MMDVQEFYNKLQITSKGQQHIEKCLNIYSKDSSVRKTLYKIWEVICSIFGQSSWQIAKKTIQQVSRQVLIEHFKECVQISDDHLTKFVHFSLNYLVTKRSIETSQSQYFIPKPIWEDHKFSKLKVEQILDRAIFGNGQSLPCPPINVLRKLLEVEKTKCKALIHQLKTATTERPITLEMQTKAKQAKNSLKELGFKQNPISYNLDLIACRKHRRSLAMLVANPKTTTQ